MKEHEANGLKFNGAKNVVLHRNVSQTIIISLKICAILYLLVVLANNLALP